MRRVVLLGILFGLLPLGAGRARPLDQPFTLIIAANPDAHLGADLKIHISITNTSSGVIALLETRTECDYIFEVHDSTGNPVPETQYKRSLAKCASRVEGGRGVLIRLKPGESKGVGDVALDKLNLFARPGKYSVQASREIPSDLGKGLVKSNILTITVTE